MGTAPLAGLGSRGDEPTMFLIASSKKIYHIVHVDRLASIAADGFLWCDAEVQRCQRPGTTIGIPAIKQRRLASRVKCRPGLHVGDCVPFYLCPRSVMLYVIHKGVHQGLACQDDQEPIVHLEADLQKAVIWANRNGHQWAFTLSNAGSESFEDRCDLTWLCDIDWEAVEAIQWQHCRERKQAEFLVEGACPWTLVQCIGLYSQTARQEAQSALDGITHKPPVDIKQRWYY